jgi:hypothetical protein
MVANAIEGAAPNKPANVFGLNRSEMIEKRQTTTPPIRKRITISLNTTSLSD